nr:pyridoxamine 5'-phosphate oxidase family protein [uncultured Hyphomonas sp.]
MKNDVKVIDLSDTADDGVRASVNSILENVRLLTLATVSPSGAPYVNTCYYAHDSDWCLHILTPPTTTHAKFLSSNPACAVNIVDTNHKVGDPISGLQLHGRAKLVDETHAQRSFETYTEKHKKFLEYAPNAEFVYSNFQSRFFRFEIIRGKLIDERSFGSENYIEFSVRGRS